MQYSEKQIQGLLKGVYSGKYTNRELPEDLYYAIADHLKKGLYDGYGMTLSTATGRDLQLLGELRENIYMFSGAKTYQEVVTMRDLLTDTDSFRDFEKRALDIYGEYNRTWLATEYDTAIGQGQCAVKWEGFVRDKDVLPNLRYSTAGGDVCEICAPLDGMVAPVDSEIWDKVAPLNHWHCMCLLEATEDDVSERDISSVVEKMDDNFIMNPGTDGYIFKEDHPYFEVAKADSGFAADNFGLPIPDKD